jgi:hypothetical protein
MVNLPNSIKQFPSARFTCRLLIGIIESWKPFEHLTRVRTSEFLLCAGNCRLKHVRQLPNPFPQVNGRATLLHRALHN